jgi:hypothetical protein
VVYEKYKEQPEKHTILAIYTPLALTALAAPLILFRRTTKKMLSTIEYHLSSNSF